MSSQANASVPSTEHHQEVTDFDAYPVSLETDINNYQVNQQALLEAWEELYSHSVEPLVAGQPEMIEFADSHTLLFAAILWNRPIQSVPSQHTALEAFMIQWNSQGASEESAESPATSTGRVMDTAGIVYVASSALPQQVHIGVCLLPRYRGKGVGRRACEIALIWAVETLQIHRVQARILASPLQHRARSLFAALGFSHEGVQRRSVANTSGEWMDVASMALLDTDWHIRKRLEATSKSIWDELLERHQREVETLLRDEELRDMMKRSNSTETVRVAPDPDYPLGNPYSGRAGRVIFTPGPLTDSASSSRASSRAPSDNREFAGQSDSVGHPRGPTSRFSPESDEGRRDSDDPDHEWVRAMSRGASHTPEDPISRPPSSASSSSYASGGSYLRVTPGGESTDEEWERFEL